MGAPANAIGDDAVDPDRRHGERERAEDAKEQRPEAPRAEFRDERPLHRLHQHARVGQRGLDLPAEQRRHFGDPVRRCANDDGARRASRAGRRRLIERQVELRMRHLDDLVLVDVRDHADHGSTWSVAADDHALTDGIASRPREPRHRLTDDDDERLALDVVIVRHASADGRESDRSPVFRARCARGPSPSTRQANRPGDAHHDRVIAAHRSNGRERN